MHFLADRVVLLADLEELGEARLERPALSRSVSSCRSERGSRGRRGDGEC